MSFGGGFGGGGGFGSNNNQSSTFGGFGSNNNANPGFGSNTNSGGSIFGQANNNAGGSIFGSSTTTSSPFGGGGGFGANNNNATTGFGSKPFGATTGGNLFGGGGSTSGGTSFGGFGSTSNNNNNNNNNTATSAFGGGNTGGSLFGQNKPAGFGSTTTGTATGGGIFGNTTTSFGSNNAAGGFGGASAAGGFGANTPNNGTATTPFNAHTEKDGTSTNATQHYQTITFQQPYQNYSLEELRLADYNQGRRYGNQNGQAGAFGQSTGFGGFGTANNNSNNNTAAASTGFGSNNTPAGGGMFGSGGNAGSTFGQSTGSAFGTNNNASSGGLFGQNKPAGGLFGPTAASQPSSGGGLFGNTSASNTGGFGSNTGGGFGTTSTAGGGGLFGGQNNQQTNQAKPFGGFGSTATNAASTPFGGGSTGTFGQSTNTGGGLFGQNNQASAAPAFGSSTTTATTGGGLFGNAAGSFGQNQQNQTQGQPTGGLFGGFGQSNQQNQQKPGGLFGSSTANTGGGLFGANNNNQPQQTGGLFGNNNATQNTGSSLFGQKPAATGTSLFGNNTNPNTGGTTGGLFGNLGAQNNQQPTGSSLFGTQNQQKPGGLFGNSAPAPNTGGGLFGNQPNGNSTGLGGSLFGGQNSQQQPQQVGMGNSLFNTSGGSLLQTSLNTNPYGNDALFSGLNTPAQSPGPLATPLSSSQKNRKSAILPQHKLNPAASTRLLTPQGKKANGYGFSYSTYGTPASASSQSTPGLSSSMFGGGSLSRSLGKSVSTSNLKNSFTPDTSILAPGAFSTNGRSFGNGSLKKLNINRSISRIPLFDEPSTPPKRVSFAAPNDETCVTPNGIVAEDPTGRELVVRHESEEASPSSAVNDDSTHRTPRADVKGSNLVSVPENGAESHPTTSANGGGDPQPGEYWSSPSLDELKSLKKDQLTSIPNFVVGRDHIGKIEFNFGKPVDLSEVPLDKLFGDIIQLNHRNATVYGEHSTVTKPQLGNGLNQPSRITLGNSWPRNRAGKKDQKHLERLKRVHGTKFEKYIPQTGDWIFTVDHFSSYGLNDDDYSDNEESSELSSVPDTPAGQLRSSQMSCTPQEGSFVSPTQSSPDDTFDFKKGMRKRASVPGGFGDEVAYEEDDEMNDTHGESFLGERSVGLLDGQNETDYTESESESVQDQNMADSVSGPVSTTEQVAARESDPFRDSVKPKSILKASQVLRPTVGTPSKNQLVFDDDWANQLQRTISPKKQDRQALRESQGDVLRERDGNASKFSQSFNGGTVPSTIDLMDSLFGETGKGTTSVKRIGRGIELPYSKRPKTANDLDQLSGSDKEFHGCNKPHFSETGILVYATKGLTTLEDRVFTSAQEPIAGAEKDIRLVKFPTFADAAPATLKTQKQQTKIVPIDGVPSAQLQTDPAPIDFAEMAKSVTIGVPGGMHEQQTWQLLSLLFDDSDDVPSDMNRELFEQHKERLRKEKLSDFWEQLVLPDVEQQAQSALSPEKRAIAYLSGHSIPDACHALLQGLDLRLATMIAQIGGDESMRHDMTSQLDEWRRMDVLSEMDDSVRALYELLSGNCAQSEGKAGGGRENKVASFAICDHFGLNWRQAFGLRLWYGTMADEPIELAVAQYADALRDGTEKVKPIPWFREQSDVPGWQDPAANSREDLLWGILKLYASSKMELPANIGDVLAPENVSGHPLNARLSFQLFQLFKSRYDDQAEVDARKVSMPTIRDANGQRSSFMSSTTSFTGTDGQDERPLVELGDKITLIYAASLHTPDHWTTALWVYTHLSSPAMREHYIRSLLNQYSSKYTLADGDPTYIYLTSDLCIPVSWIHSAAALEAKTEGDALRQAMHLIKAGALEEAHEVLCRSVGPDSIISRDYDALRELMGGFIPTPTNSPILENGSVASSFRDLGRPKEPVRGWAHGGQIYFDYIELLDLTNQRSSYRVDDELNQQIDDLLHKLQRALEAVAKERMGNSGLEERVALTEIAGTVAGLVAKNNHASRARILNLPLTEDLFLKHACNSSTNYYRNAMAASQ